MYQKLRVEFRRPIVYTNSIGKQVNFNKEARDFIKLFNKSYGTFLRPDRDSESGEEYVFNDREINFEEIFSLLSPYDNCIDYRIIVEAEYEPKDFDDAAAVMMCFPKTCYYYDEEDSEEDDEKYNSQVTLCENEGCWATGHKEKMYIKPNNGMKKAFEGKFAGASTPYRTHIISDMLYEYLLENGIDEKYFRPVYQKNGKVWAHYIYFGEHIIPSLSMISQPMDSIYECPVCNRRTLRRSSYEQIKFELTYFKNATTIGEYPLSERMIIKEEVLADLEDANLTEDYWLGDQNDVVSKRLFELIRAKIPKIIRTSQPIFKAKFDVLVRHGWVVTKYL